MADKRWQTSPEYNRILLGPDGDEISVQPVHHESICARGPGSLVRAVKLDNELIPRILACLNACEGVPIEELKPGVVSDLFERVGEPITPKPKTLKIQFSVHDSPWCDMDGEGSRFLENERELAEERCRELTLSRKDTRYRLVLE